MRGSSYTLRAVCALTLMVGFYALALGMVAAIVWMIVGSLQQRHFNVRLVVFGGIAALLILKSVLPRIDVFVAPGPLLRAERQPRLFAELRDVARRVGQEMPAEVYLIPDVNAWVSQRGGVLGVGGRRIMGLGLPLLHGLTTSQMRAVIGHEFGHFHGGDTRLGPIVYRTRSAIGRTIQSLSASWLQLPFRWYGKMFLRVTQAVSRHQEYAADALAAEHFGPVTLRTALEALPGLAEAFPAYWAMECAPALEIGRRPPIGEGFVRFLASPDIASAVARVRDAALGESAGSPYDTHPPLPERIAALQPDGEAPPEKPTQRAASLLDDLPALEQSLLRHVCGEDALGFAPVAWEDVAHAVWLPVFRRAVGEAEEGLCGVGPGDVPRLLRDPGPLVRFLDLPPDLARDREQREAGVVVLLGRAVVLALHEKGWRLTTDPGEPVRVERDGAVHEPVALVARLHQGELSEEAWHAFVRDTGIQDVDFATLASPPPVAGRRSRPRPS